MVDYLKEYAAGLYTDKEFEEKRKSTFTAHLSQKNPCSTAKYLKVLSRSVADDSRLLDAEQIVAGLQC